MKASNHAVKRYLERELEVAPTNSRRRVSDSVVLRDLERERPVDVESARREIERIFECQRMEQVTQWANGASFRVIVNGRVYCCRGGIVTTFYRATPRSGTRKLRRRPPRAVRIQSRSGTEAIRPRRSIGATSIRPWTVAS